MLEARLNRERRVKVWLTSYSKDKGGKRTWDEVVKNRPVPSNNFLFDGRLIHLLVFGFLSFGILCHGWCVCYPS